MQCEHPEIYVFESSDGTEYVMEYAVAGSIVGLNPDFWDKFYAAERIRIDFVRREDGVRAVLAVRSWK